MGKRYAGDVLMTIAVLLRSRVMGNYQARFWRAVEGVTPSLTLIILKKGLSTVGHTGTLGLDPINAWGENTSTFSEVILSKQVISVNQESPYL
jgi:putative transposase